MGNRDTGWRLTGEGLASKPQSCARTGSKHDVSAEHELESQFASLSRSSICKLQEDGAAISCGVSALELTWRTR
eukprot:5533511-Pleurochrysis_carterae.AAC.3